MKYKNKKYGKIFLVACKLVYFSFLLKMNQNAESQFVYNFIVTKTTDYYDSEVVNIDKIYTFTNQENANTCLHKHMIQTINGIIDQGYGSEIYEDAENYSYFYISPDDAKEPEICLFDKTKHVAYEDNKQADFEIVQKLYKLFMNKNYVTPENLIIKKCKLDEHV